MTASLGVSRFGDRMNAIGRSLGGRVSAASLAVLAILAGAATYAWLTGLVPAAFVTTGWMTGLLVADLAHRHGAGRRAGGAPHAALARSAPRRGRFAPAHAAGAGVQHLHHHADPDRLDHPVDAVDQSHRFRGQAGPGLVRGRARHRRAGAAGARERDPARHRGDFVAVAGAGRRRAARQDRRPPSS